MSQFPVKLWYPEIADDFEENGFEKVVGALTYYESVWRLGQKHTITKGKLEWLMQEQPDILRTFQDVLADVSMVHKWLDEHVKFMKATKRRWYLSADAREEYGEIKKTDVDMYVNSDRELKSIIDLQLMVELHKRALENIVVSIEKRGIMLAMISKIRIAGQHEVFIDTTHETRVDEL